MLAHAVEEAVARRRNRAGRAPEYPPLVGVLHMLLAGGITGSHRSSARTLASARVWSLVRDAALRAHGVELPEDPPTRNHLEAWRSRLEKHVGMVRDVCRQLALRQAMEAGCLDPGAASGDVRSVLYADGKVVAAPMKDGEAVERWREQGRRVDVGLYQQQGEDAAKTAMGTKFVLCGVRAGESRNARIVLDVAHEPHKGSSLAVQGYGGEAGIAVRSLLVLAAQASEHGGHVRAVCYDGAFRGVHIGALMRAGLTVLSPVHPQSAKTTPFQIVRDCRCGRKHELDTKDGELFEQRRLDSGAPFVKPLARKRLHRRSKSQGCAWYVEHKLPCGATRTTRLDFGDDPVRKTRNTAERLRQHPPGSPLYEKLYGRREEAESTNNVVDRTLYGGRMTAYTAERQILVMLGFQLARNVLARHALSRTRPAAAA